MLIQAIELGIALAAILLLARFAARLGLGSDVRLHDEAEARALASAVIDGFAPDEAVLDRAGIGALLRDAQGHVVLLRRHGARFVARRLDSHAHTRLDRHYLTIGTGERFFGTTTLNLGEAAQVWAGSLRRLGRAQ